MSDVPVPLGPRMIAACVGSLITSVVVNPFDVIRVRMQQESAWHSRQAAETALKSTARSIHAPTEPNSASVATAKVHIQPVLEASTGGNAPKVCCKDPFWYPSTIDYCSTPDLHCNKGRLPGTFSVMANMVRDEGITSLWRGLSLQLVQSIPANVVYFISYEQLRDSSLLKNNVIGPLLAGGLARTLASTVVSPLELFKTRLQSVRGRNAFEITMRSVREMIRNEGFRSLWSGLGLTLYRDVPFSSIYWMVVELVRRQFPRKKESAMHALGESFIAGSVGGMVAAVLTTPFDVAKTRRQLGHHSTASAHMKMLPFMAHIVQTDGWRALFVGLTPRVLKVAPACAIMISSYEIGKIAFTNKEKAKLNQH